MRSSVCYAFLFLAGFPVAVLAKIGLARDTWASRSMEHRGLKTITDVQGVEVGQTTLISGDDVRTGVTAILPPGGKRNNDAVFAGWFSQNGDGEMTGTTWVEESGFLDGPVMITNTHSVGVVRDAVIAWGLECCGPGCLRRRRSCRCAISRLRSWL
ncbi:MAG TPA: P1 family peptidase [Terriglobales bacterium]|nr:P1 family peptidase [Terriglobales bacterium]